LGFEIGETMPELPEVETVRRTLETKILSKTIESVEVKYEPMIKGCSVEEFKQRLVGQTFQSISRYGKYLLFVLTDCILLSHLRMEGKYFIKDRSEPVEKHEHVIFHFTDNVDLRYHDVRKFGVMQIYSTTSLETVLKQEPFSRMGEEACSDHLSTSYLYHKLTKLSMPIKTALLDQAVLCGLGNIYVDEVLFESSIDPRRKSSSLSVQEVRRLVFFIRKTMAEAILAGGTTIRSYTSSLGVTGLFQFSLFVHTKKNEPCPFCQTIIQKTVVGGRGTYFCSHCQSTAWPYLVGITGGIATGKSFVTSYLTSQGYSVIDSDVISHKASTENEEVKKNIRITFGDEYFDEKGSLDRKKLGALVFSSTVARQKLTELIHPVIFNEILKEIRTAKTPILFLDAPLLFESHLDLLCNQVIVVSADEATQIKRLCERDQITKEIAIQKINAQLPLTTKITWANNIIDNSLSKEETIKQINQILEQIKKEVPTWES
jgi:formamidopyrimidine-DNA glycosylase